MEIKPTEQQLHRRLFWVLSAVLPLLIFTVVILVLFTRQQEKTMVRSLSEHANNSAHVLERVIGEQIGLLNGLAISHSLDDGEFDDFRLDAQRIWKMHPEWRTVIITNEHRPIFNLRHHEGEPIPPLRDSESLKQVWTTQKPAVGDLAHGYVAIRVPIVRNERIIFTLVAPVDPCIFQDAIQTSLGTYPWGFIIVDGNNVVVAASSDSPVPAGKLLPQSFLQKKWNALSPADMRYAAPVSINESNWRIFVFAPAASVEMPFVKVRWIVYLCGFLAAAASIVLVLVLTSAWTAKQETIRLRKEIDGRLRAQKALQEGEQRFRLLVENAPDAIFVQTQGRFAYLNRAALELFGASASTDLIGAPVIERFHPDYRNSVQDRIKRLNDEKKTVPRMLGVCLQMDGTAVNVDSSAVPIAYGGQNGALVFMRDMTEFIKVQTLQKELEDQLHQVQKIESVGRLAGGVAHDYNNMLSVIIGFTELALDKVAPDQPLHDDLEEIFSAAKRSAGITRQLLAFARKQPISPIVLDLNDTVESMLSMLRRLIGEDIDLAWHPQKDLWPVKMDPSQVDQILANLCVNASDAISDVGKITIETGRTTFDQAYCAQHAGFIPGDFVLLAVSDDGCGMDRDTRDKIFEPFFTTKELGQGTGLGLATVYGIVKQNNGFINVYSEEGKGSTFKIYLPGHAGQAIEGRSLHVGKIPRGHDELVLVVEDEPATLKLVETMLVALGYRVVAAENPSKALQLAQEHRTAISLLMTDVVMPEMNGRELSQRLQELNPDLKCLFMSGYTANVIAHRGVLDEGVNFIQKPFSKKDLAIKVREALN